MLKYLNAKGLKYLFKRGLRFTWQGTKEEWDSLSDDEKNMYDNAFVSGDVSDEEGGCDCPAIFTGTKEEWNNLGDKKNDYDIAFVED